MPDAKLGAVVVAALLVGSVVGGGAAMVAMSEQRDPETAGDPGPGDTGPGVTNASAGVVRFDGPADFEQYVRDGQATAGAPTGGITAGTAVDGAVRAAPTEATADAGRASGAGEAGGDGGEAAVRHSSTNVQEIGIDEPDILKTTGEHVYYAPRRPRVVYAEPAIREDEKPKRPDASGPATQVYDTSDPADPRSVADIDATGPLLQTGDRLVVFEGDRLTAYDVSDPSNPSEAWSRPLNASVETARLLNGTIYLVTRSGVDYGSPCPVAPLGGEGATVQCTDVFHPRRQIAVDATYTAYSVDPTDGAVGDSVSFVGSRGRSTVYVSADALYVTYTERTGRGALLLDALLATDTEVPTWVEDRLREIESYDLSAGATRTEVTRAVEQWLGGLADDRRETVSDRLRADLSAYVREHRRDLVTTGVVRVGLDESEGLSVDATGTVPGEPLSQFSMDQHEGTLRIATTIPRQFEAESVNDLYTLDAETLERQGAVTGMGVGERVYAVRYVGETAYVVTYRQVDPFHVVDLSDPAAPEEVGTLKLPGYSSYLHPVDETHVLGIGEEEGRVKAVLFDVSDPSDPTVEDTYRPDAGWSAVAQSHHAFLLDSRHGVFFLPGGSSGFVVEYTDGDLSLRTRVSTEGTARRAAYVGDHLYVFGDRGLVVVDETDWSVAARRSFEE